MFIPHEYLWLKYTIGITIVLVVAFSAVASIAHKLFGYWTIRRQLNLVEDILKAKSIAPRAIVAFDRSSGIFAGMLAQRLSIGELLVLPRSVASEDRGKPRHIMVGKGLRFNVEMKKAFANSVVFVYHLRTGATLEAGMEFLEDQQVATKSEIVALYATRGGQARWPSAITVHTIDESSVPNESFSMD